MLDIKQWIKKVTEWLSDHNYDGFGSGIQITDYTTQANAYTAPCDGLVWLHCRYTATNYVGVTIVNPDGTGTLAYQIGGNGQANHEVSMPIFKGQKVWKSANNGINNTVWFVPFIKVGGVVRRLLNTLQSLAYRGGGASVECKALISQNAYPVRRLLGCGRQDAKLFIQQPKIQRLSARRIKDWVYTFGRCGLHLFSSRLVLLKYRLTGNTSKSIYIQKLKYNSVSKVNIEGIIPQRLTASVKGVAVC